VQVQHVEYELEREDIIAFGDHYFSHDPKNVNRMQTMRTVWAIICVGVAFTRFNRSPEYAIGMVAFGLAIFIFYPSVVRVLYRRENRQMAHKLEAANLGRVELTLDNQQIRSKSAASESTFKVSSLNRMEETPGYFFIYVGPNQAIVVPKQRIISGDMQSLADELSQCIPMKSFS
jgi:hypothetical protein